MYPVSRRHGAPPIHIRTSSPYETTHDDIRIPLPDRTRLYARVWRPLPDEPW
ncbi:hypothetical protein [Streptomyces sp. NPDC001435]|uniref:hypothetical protein n=1 Tax=unclassified Streptomyces TaxID=2593676 RepID=UPI0036A586E7